MVNQAINGKKMEKEVFKQVNLERGFSCVKRIKSNLRSTLTTETLDVLVRISLDGRSLEEFDPMPAVKHWWEAGERSRRPGFRPH